ncbi:MAG: sigma-70 family RNA polymerase sigma factor [Akkermansiaceae bacterium]
MKQENRTARDPRQDGEEIVGLAMKGDLKAFEEVVKRHQAGVRGFLAARLSRKEEAEDLAQEVFVTAFRKRGTFSGEVNIEAWFRGIARNLLMNHVRKFRAQPIGGSEELQILIDREFDAEQNDGETLDALQECLTELKGAARELITQRYFEGVSVRDLESKTGRGYSALTMQLHRIRTVLAECIESKLGDSLNSGAK